MRYTLSQFNSFKKDIKRCKKRGYNFELLKKVLDKLAREGELPAKYKSHKLSGNYQGRWECHIKPDWLLIWKQDDDNKEIILERTGTHSDLFR